MEGTLFGSDNGNWDRIGLLNFDANSAAKWGVSNGSTGTIPYNSSRTLDTNYHILSIGLNSGTSDGSFVSLDGANPTTFTESAGNASYSTTAIGALRPNDGNFAMEGYIGEIFFAKLVVNSSERQKLEGYLAHKWGLTNSLPSNHPFKTYAPEKASHAWVKAPSISGTSTVITAAWGKTGTENTPDYATIDPVWSNGYEGVWHFTGSSTNFPDSSPNSHHATRNSVGITQAGQVGKAAAFLVRNLPMSPIPIF